MKTVLITGGSRGIGAEMVKTFSAQGYRVAFTYNKSKKAADELSIATGAMAVHADSRIEPDVCRAVELCIKELGHIDALINNAGTALFSLITDLSLENWNDVVSTNLTGAFLYSREAAKHMISRKSGAIVNVTSVWGLVGSSCEAAYSATKAALIGLTKAMAKELGPSGIRVNAVAPGVIDTDMNSMLASEDVAALAEETPLMRIGDPAEVARAALFLCGEESSFITGDVLNVSGGFVI